MKMNKQLGTICAVLLGFSGSVAALPVNPGFENGVLSPWFEDRTQFAAGGPGTYEDWNVTSADAHTGSYSATATDNIEIRQDFAAVDVANILEVSFWAKHEGSGSAMYVSLFYGDGTESNTIPAIPEGDWVFVDVTSTLLPGKQLTGFSVFGNSGDCPGVSCTRSYLDDLLVRTGQAGKVPEPATLLLLGLGLAGFGYVRRHSR